MAAFKLTLVSPHGKAFEGDCESLVSPGYSGEFGVLAGHAPMIAMLKRGITKITAGSETSFYVTGEGVCEVSKDGVNVLVDTATKTASLDEAKKELANHLAIVGAK
jgi:F-type H+-transporting ATPase subunit epsilon